MNRDAIGTVAVAVVLGFCALFIAVALAWSDEPANPGCRATGPDRYACGAAKP